MKTLLRIAAIPVAAAIVFDPCRILVSAMLLEKARKVAPDCFDGAKAAKNINESIALYAAIYESE